MSAPVRDENGRFTPGAPTPRELLAEAIAKLQTAEERLMRAQQAASRAEELSWQASRDISGIEGDLDAVRGQEGSWLAAALLAGKEPGEAPAKALAAALDEARSRKAELSAASSRLSDQVEAEQRALEYAQRAVKDTASAVLATSPAVAAAVERLEAAQAELIASADEVMWLTRVGVIPIKYAPPGGFEVNEGLARRASAVVRRLESGPLSWQELIRQKPGTAAWQSVLDALLIDPEAEIPE